MRTSELKKKAILVFNKFIRKRDEGKPCISCGKFRPLQAGHYYPVKNHNSLRFNLDNCHGQCSECNCMKYGNVEAYRKNLIKRIGEDRVMALDVLAMNKNPHFDSREELMEVIQKYSLT